MREVGGAGFQPAGARVCRLEAHTTKGSLAAVGAVGSGHGGGGERPDGRGMAIGGGGTEWQVCAAGGLTARAEWAVAGGTGGRDAGGQVGGRECHPPGSADEGIRGEGIGAVCHGQGSKQPCPCHPGWVLTGHPPSYPRALWPSRKVEVERATIATVEYTMPLVPNPAHITCLGTATLACLVKTFFVAACFEYTPSRPVGLAFKQPLDAAGPR